MLNVELKSFFYSFVLSLFVFFGINKACFDAPQTSPSLIPKTNISLFLKDGTQRHSAKIPKISLTKSIEKTFASSSDTDTNDFAQKVLDIKTKDLPELPRETALPKKNEKVSASAAQIKVIPLKKQPLQQVKVLRVSDNTAPDTAKKIDNRYSVSKSQKQVSAALTPSITQPQEKKYVSDVVPLLKEPFVRVTQNDDTLLIPLEKSRAFPQFAAQKVQINPEFPQAQIAMKNASKPISAVVEENKKPQNNEPTSSHAAWQTMSEKNKETIKTRQSKEIYHTSQVDTPSEEKDNTSLNVDTQDSPWVKVGSAAFPKNSEVIKQKFYNNETALQKDDSFKLAKILSKESQAENTSKQEIKVAGEVLDNIIIPIPQDILDDKDLMPNLVSDPKNKKLEDELLAKEKEKKDFEADDIPFIAEEKKQSTLKQKNDKEEKSIFKSIASFFSSDDKNGNSSVNDDFYDSEDEEGSQSEESTINHPKTKQKNKNKILPSEIRLAFQTGRAEISGKTLDWIKAFGQKALENDDVVLEIRIDGTASIALQQKRLNLLYNILTNLGLGYNKVNTVFTNRSPNTFILRVVKAGEDSDKKRFDPASFYYRKW